MLASLAAFLLHHAARPDSAALIADLSKHATAKDITAIEARATPELKGKFAFLKVPGSFGVGRFGWTAELLQDSTTGTEYAVFTTPLTTQDYGDQVFRIEDGKLAAKIDERTTRGVTPKHANFIIGFDLPKKSASFLAQLTLNVSVGADKDFFLRLGPNHDVIQALDSAGKPIKISQAGGVISLPTPPPGEHKITLVYEGVINRPRFAGSITDTEVMLTNDLWWPAIARLPFTFKTTVSVPKDWEVVAQGNRVSDTIIGDKRSIVTEMPLPISYLSLSAGPFYSEELLVEGRTYRMISKTMPREQMKTQLELIPPVFDFFEQFAPYPFNHYEKIVTPLYGGGALEAYSFATYGPGWLPAEEPHEPSHTWWGGIVPCTYLDSFWNESFAVFSEGLYAREGRVGDKPTKRLAFIGDFGAEDSYLTAPVGTTGANDGNAASAVGYGKGAWVLQQLEFEVGTEVMIQKMKEFVATHPAGTASDWPQFRTLFGPEMDWFFKQWLDEPGVPGLEILGVDHQNEVAALNLKFEGQPVRMTVEVLVETSSETKLHRVDLRPNPDGSCAVEIPAPGQIKRIVVDPYDRLMTDDNTSLPYRWSDNLRRMRAFVDPKHDDWWPTNRRIDKLPESWEGLVIVGHPATLPEARILCDIAGFEISGDFLTYKDVTIDLRKDQAVAMVEFAPGKWCGLSVGKAKIRPNVGRATAAVVDHLGRFLMGETRPRDQGPLVWTPKG
ncbi:MAG: hypothetical protein LCH41_10585 [Armatimonadetes bacterium]|nr:hypothetical protein [Armatimonadota bacterium]